MLDQVVATLYTGASSSSLFRERTGASTDNYFEEHDLGVVERDGADAYVPLENLSALADTATNSPNPRAEIASAEVQSAARNVESWLRCSSLEGRTQRLLLLQKLGSC